MALTMRSASAAASLGWCRGPCRIAKLVAAEAGDHVAGAGRLAQPVGDRPQHRVANRVAMQVVDRLEVIEVDAERRPDFAAADPCLDRFHPLAEEHAVGEVGEAVVPRQVPDLRLGPALLGNVLVCGHPAAVAHRLMQDGDDAAVLQFVLVDRLFLADRRRHGALDVEFRSCDGMNPALDPVLEDLKERCARTDEFRRSP